MARRRWFGLFTCTVIALVAACTPPTTGGGATTTTSASTTTTSTTTEAPTTTSTTTSTSTSTTTEAPTTTSTSTTTSTTTTTVPPGPQRYLDQVFSASTVTSNVTYGQAVNNLGQLQTLRLDVYQPTGDTVTNRPAMVWVHGGSFVGGDKTDLASEATFWARRGYVVVSINYRLQANATWNPVGSILDTLADPTWVAAVTRATDDAGTAIAWLRTNAATYRVDPDRIASAGVSAGGAVALNTAFLPDRSLGQGTGTDPKRVKAAAAIVGATLPTYIEPGEGPVFMANGTQDTIIPVAFAQAVCADAATKGVTCEYHEYNSTHEGIAAFTTDIRAKMATFLYASLVTAP